MKDVNDEITQLILKAAEKARKETSDMPEQEWTRPVRWPVACTVGPGLEGAIACESKVSYVNGSQGQLIYCGYDIFDLCAYSTYEEVSYLLLHKRLPNKRQLAAYKKKLARYRRLPATLRLLMGFPVEDMNVMAALRMGTNFMRQEFTLADQKGSGPLPTEPISADEDSIPMETPPRGERHAIYEFKPQKSKRESRETVLGVESCYHLIAGVATVAAAIQRIRSGQMPVEPDPEMSHAGNFLYMLTGKRPSPLAERIMDVTLILHADHGINASTFATMVVASTLSDIYLSMGAGIAALNGPLHGGANEAVLKMLKEIGSVENVGPWFERACARKQKIMGFGHRVYKAYDPRARILAPLVRHLARRNKEIRPLFRTARALEKLVVRALGAEKKIFPNVDFYSGLTYACMGIPQEMFTPIFAVSRVSGWTARVNEYLKNNRIFRPRAIYVGAFGKKYVPIAKRSQT